MVTKNELIRIMKAHTEMALATSVDGQPNVRIVNFYFDDTANILFFTTFGDNDKVREFEANSQVAFTTVPHHGNEHVKAKGTVKKSGRTIFEVAEGFTSKIPDYQETIEQAGEYLVLYEIKCDTAVVTLDFENIDTIRLSD
ncbi:pyridoxamine 5'-phosphate oxidase family protein [Anoxynatronum buryatiense]|uniref:Pyridoxamine 5'-phosphate oxidase n=1 Tax=Anoxynatronum buryatiense TaxID=489973 RepID=A0AA45WTK1_9CLOT|nr:pyridoxamine 5'-phosphate oxidase family protein [Anoxynatronum buryatiense]SMP43509.1 Pyridoxamine 5'-phosphate oxidase [Anoxynatronum buryatiense]